MTGYIHLLRVTKEASTELQNFLKKMFTKDSLGMLFMEKNSCKVSFPIRARETTLKKSLFSTLKYVEVQDSSKKAAMMHLELKPSLPTERWHLPCSFMKSHGQAWPWKNLLCPFFFLWREINWRWLWLDWEGRTCKQASASWLTWKRKKVFQKYHHGCYSGVIIEVILNRTYFQNVKITERQTLP